jgi:hypothetical protein
MGDDMSGSNSGSNLPERDSDGKLPAFAWPGGAPLVYMTADGGELCPACANGENGSEAYTTGHEPSFDDGSTYDAPDWHVVGYSIHEEGAPIRCDHCGAEVESAYGIPGEDDFIDGYITCVLWSSTDESTPSGGYPLDQNYDIDDIAPESRAKMEADCKAFIAANLDDIPADRMAGAGHDFWLTRNGHGDGFWDGDWPEDSGRRLTDAAHAYGESDLYIGDDGKIYTMEG